MAPNRLEPITSKPRVTGLKSIFASDLRALAIFRMGLGALVMIDTIMRGSDLAAHYSDTGVLPSGTYINEFAHPLHISLHLANGSIGWQQLLFALTFLFGAMLFFGYRTRLATIAAWVMIVSVQNRNPMVLNGGDVLFRCLLFFAMFLPLHARYSVDRALATDDAPKSNEWLAGGSVAILLQVAFVYWSTVLLKTGSEWWPEGSASYYALSLDSFVTSFGAFMVQWTTFLKYATFAVYFFEAAAPFLLFCPFFFGPVRMLTLLGLMTLHLNFDISMRLGLFPWIDIVACFALIPGSVLDRLEGWIKSDQRKKLRIFYDGDCGFCKKAVLLLREFMLAREVVIGPSQLDPRANAAFKASNSWVVRTHDGVDHVNWAGMVAVIEHSLWFSWVGRLLPLTAMAPLGDYIYGCIKGHRGLLALITKRMFPYGEIGTLKPYWLTNVFVLFMIGYVGLWNLMTIPSINVEIVDPWTKIGSVTRLDQKWNMFAPFPLKEDGWFVIEGQLRDKTPVDLMKGTETPASFEKPKLAAYEFKNARWRKYLMNIWSKKKRAHRLYYGRYLCRNWNHAQPDDDKKLVSFQIHFMKERTQPPGEPQPVQKVTIWTHDCFKKPDDPEKPSTDQSRDSTAAPAAGSTTTETTPASAQHPPLSPAAAADVEPEPEEEP